MVRRHGTTRNTYGLFDVNRNDDESASELYYNDTDGDGFLSDDERDEDADGLTNYDESHGRMNAEYWNGCYSTRSRTTSATRARTSPIRDTDGDGVRDGADDQDHDDIPNLAELSRVRASGLFDGESSCKPHPDAPKPPDTNHPERLRPGQPVQPVPAGHLVAHLRPATSTQ